MLSPPAFLDSPRPEKPLLRALIIPCYSSIVPVLLHCPCGEHVHCVCFSWAGKRSEPSYLPQCSCGQMVWFGCWFVHRIDVYLPWQFWQCVLRQRCENRGLIPRRVINTRNRLCLCEIHAFVAFYPRKFLGLLVTATYLDWYSHCLAIVLLPYLSEWRKQLSCSSFYPQSLVTGQPDIWMATNKSFMEWNNDSVSRKNISENLISIVVKPLV